jgi:L-lactate dehydrogenase
MNQVPTIGRRKVAIIGAGFVGSSIAYALALRDIAREIAIIDINEDKAMGESKDIRHGIPSVGTVDLYAGDYSSCKDCDLIIITAGRNRKPGETRLDLAQENINIMRNVVDEIKKHYNGGVIMVISNPCDVLTYKVAEWMDLPSGMVFGSGCILDTSRFIRVVADYVGLSTGVISGYIVAEHGDMQFPLWSRVLIGSFPIAEYCESMGLAWTEEIRKEIAEETKTMGAEIIEAKGKTHFGIATCVCHLADAILNQKPTIASVSTPIPSTSGGMDVALSVPSVVGPSGVSTRIREKWEPDEYRQFFDAVVKMREFISKLD